MEPDQSWKVKLFVIGGIVGALVGVGAAFLIAKRAEVEQKPPELSTGEGIQLGLGVLGLLRLIASTEK